MHDGPVLPYALMMKHPLQPIVVWTISICRSRLSTCFAFVVLLFVASFAMNVDASISNPLTESLPRTDGTVEVDGLAGDVVITRDALGVPTISGKHLHDVIRAQGFVHAQERFFQMDLGRRYAAGELAELIGSEALNIDKQKRPLQMKAVAQQILDNASQSQHDQLAAYAAGVNAGLQDMQSPPVEYSFLKAQPREWQPIDSVLILLSFMDALHATLSFEESATVMSEALPQELSAFLIPLTSRFDSPVIADEDETSDYEPQPIPAADVFDVRNASSQETESFDDIAAALAEHNPIAGSNNWAVSAERSGVGRAIVANDPHLQLSVPGVWFRVELQIDNQNSLSGVSLPGLPLIVIGSNAHVAWGFTNAPADFQDHVLVDVDPDDPSRYRTSRGWEHFESVEETIAIAGEKPQTISVRKSKWGPVVGSHHTGQPIALKWTALDASMVNLNLFDMLEAIDLDEAIATLRGWYGPAQNAIVADDSGRIGWVMTGYLPKRVGFTGRVSKCWADGNVGWDGPVDESLRPMLLDPPGGILFTANNRTVPVEQAMQLGTTWRSGTRASRIGELLNATEQMDEGEHFQMQLDSRVAFYDFYQQLAMAIDPGDDPRLKLALKMIDVNAGGWDGYAEVDARGLPLLIEFHLRLRAAIMSPIVIACRRVSPGFRYSWPLREEPLRRILEEQPLNFLPRQFDSWDSFLAETWQVSVDHIIAREENGLDVTWGEINLAQIEHPAASAAGALARMLNMPADPQPGHRSAIRVSTPTFGASMRMVVSPGHEASGILHMPAGQSGHPMSHHYRDHHSAWANGQPLPFGAGEAKHKLILKAR